MGERSRSIRGVQSLRVLGKQYGEYILDHKDFADGHLDVQVVLIHTSEV
jgi:hypothetical protein